MNSEPAPVIRVVDDDASVRTSLTRVLRAAGFEARAYASAAELLVDYDPATPGCIVLDVGLPGMNGIELHAALARKGDPAIVFLTGRGDVATGVRAMKDGAVDFLGKPVKREVLIDSVNQAVARDRETRAQRARREALETRFALLTAREREVFARVVTGKLNKQIADELAISIRTVKSHRARVVEKMQVGSLADLVRAADQLRGELRV